MTAGGIASKALTVAGDTTAIARIDPASAPMKAIVAIEGSGFGEQQGSSSVSVGGIAAQVVSWSSKRIGIRVPAIAKGSRPVRVTTAGGQADGKVRVRDLILRMERGECDESFLGTLAGTCWVLAPEVKRQRDDGGVTRIHLEVENIRRRWYEVTGAPGGSFVLGPDNRRSAAKKLLKDVPVLPGANLVLFADGTSPKALGLHVLDLVLIAATGKPLQVNKVDAALQLLSSGECLSGFGATVGAHLARLDLMAVLGEIRALPHLASDDRCLRDAFRTLGVTEAKLSRLGDFARIIKLVSIIARELESMTAPQFDSVSVVGE
jgi:hypothetical protein